MCCQGGDGGPRQLCLSWGGRARSYKGRGVTCWVVGACLWMVFAGDCGVWGCSAPSPRPSPRGRGSRSAWRGESVSTWGATRLFPAALWCFS